MTGADRILGAVLLALAAVPAALAQPTEEPTAVERAAEAALQAIPAISDPAWTTRWDATGIRMNRGPVTWHLADPDRPDENGAAPARFRRTAWVGARGQQFSVAVCGDAEAVGAIAFRFSNDQSDALAAAFAAQGAAPELIEAHRAPEIEDPWDDEDYEAWTPERASARYALTSDDRWPATLETEVSCTSPRSRAAQSCRTDARVVYAPDVAGATECVNPGRY